MSRAGLRPQPSAAPPVDAAPAERPAAVVAAMRRELAGVLARVEPTRRLDLGGCRVVCGRLGRVPLIVAWTGEGRSNAERGVGALLERLPVGRLLGIGVSGALSPALGPGALVVARRVLDGGPDRVHAPDAAWLRQALGLAEATPGIAVTTSRVLCSGADKAAAWRDLDPGEPAVVDLESAAWARAAADRGVPFLIVRAVCDAADESLPIDFNRCRDRHGGIRRSAVLGRAILRPDAIAPLWRMRGRVALCADRLARFVVPLLGGGTR